MTRIRDPRCHCGCLRSAHGPAVAGATIGSTYRTAAVRDGLSQHGHGHVVPRFDGSKARCGGPAICATCAKDAAALQQAERSNAAPY